MTQRGLFFVGPLSLVFSIAFLAIRHRFAGFESLGSIFLGAALMLQFYGYQRILRGNSSELALGIHWSQCGWFLFALGLPGQGPALGAANFAIQHVLVKMPLTAVVDSHTQPKPVVLLIAFLALVGCLPFATFSAYFQTFVPLMSSPATVTSMQETLFSGNALWAAIILCSVVYQSCALGYFYWAYILPSAGDRSSSRYTSRDWWLIAGLLASAGLGLAHQSYSFFLRSAVRALGIIL